MVDRSIERMAARASTLYRRSCRTLDVMKNDPIEAQVPRNGRAAALLSNADFYDAWSIESDATGSPALRYFISATERTPRWVDVCMNLRNHAGLLVGLKNLGSLSAVASGKPAEDYQPGERVGIFTVFENAFDEALIGDG